MSSHELEYHAAASDEVAKAVDWYEQIDSQVADKFKLELARAERLGVPTFTEQRDFVSEGSLSSWLLLSTMNEFCGCFSSYSSSPQLLEKSFVASGGKSIDPFKNLTTSS
jgi:hypothetical protein